MRLPLTGTLLWLPMLIVGASHAQLADLKVTHACRCANRNAQRVTTSTTSVQSTYAPILMRSFDSWSLDAPWRTALCSVSKTAFKPACRSAPMCSLKWGSRGYSTHFNRFWRQITFLAQLFAGFNDVNALQRPTSVLLPRGNIWQQSQCTWGFCRNSTAIEITFLILSSE